MCIFIHNIQFHVSFLENTSDVDVNWDTLFLSASAKLGQRTCVDVNWDTLFLSASAKLGQRTCADVNWDTISFS